MSSLGVGQVGLEILMERKMRLRIPRPKQRQHQDKKVTSSVSVVSLKFRSPMSSAHSSQGNYRSLKYKMVWLVSILFTLFSSLRAGNSLSQSRMMAKSFRPISSLLLKSSVTTPDTDTHVVHISESAMTHLKDMRKKLGLDVTLVRMGVRSGVSCLHV